MKIHILYELKDGPYGGANQFLKAVRGYFMEQGLYAQDMEEADAFLFNSCNDVEVVIRARKRYPNKIFIQRMDGPSRVYNKKSDMRDFIANTMHRVIADATIFQSAYSRDMNHAMGLKPNHYEATILNAPDSNKFYAPPDKKFPSGDRIKLVATSWSANMNKGFRAYEYLDRNLDFNKYEMCFVGNSPILFHNIRLIKPLDSKQLGDFLRGQDIYITGSAKESCSNALIEAMFCGLPSIAPRDGGNTEIVGRGGALFDQPEEIPALLEKITGSYDKYLSRIRLPNLEEAGAMYAEFISSVAEDVRLGGKKPKRLTAAGMFRIRFSLLARKVCDKFFLSSQGRKGKEHSVKKAGNSKRR